MENNKNNIAGAKPSREIDVVALIIKVIKRPIPLIIFLVIFTALGVFYALATPKKYSATVLLAPEISSSSSISGSLSDIASNFGIDLNKGGASVDAIYPDIYPDVISSPDFLLKLLDVKVRLKDNDSLRTYEHHLTKEQSMPVYEIPKMWVMEMMTSEEEKNEGKNVGGEDRFKISRLRSELCASMAKNITCLVDKKTSVISLSMEDQDPLVAAIMIDTVQNRLQEYIKDYRTRKSTKDYNYYKELYLEAKTKYANCQKAYADYCDANQDLELASFVVERDALEDKMQTAYNTMSQLHIHMQTAEAKIRENTPAFTIVMNPRMAYRASSTPRSHIVLFFMFIGFVCDVLWVNLIRKNK
ncbi:MAG: chain-length determining protein [Bacteroidaceae bacterium]|nr:chain-length determining protein [Bacteroidaceae bacterium]